jgi:esterase/lipase superfamily enzyme
VGALADHIDAGRIQLVCVDSVDGESWYARDRHPADRVRRHLEYEAYIVEEVLPRMPGSAVACGASFGALHAVLLAVRKPGEVGGFIAMSGAYDTSKWLDGYHDDSTYFTNLLAFLPGLNDEAYLGPLRAQHPKVIATGEHDPNVDESRRLAGLLRDKGVQVGLEIWPGWAHDWPYWKDMMRRYVSDI